MINKYSSNVGIPFFSEGSLKTWQKVQNYSNNFVLGSKRIEKTRLPSFVLPYSDTGAQVQKMELYKIIGPISNAFSYEYFITLRSLVYEINTAELLNSLTFETRTFNAFLGQTINELESGVYEIVVTMDDNTIFESETLLVGCPELSQKILTSNYMFKTEQFEREATAGLNVGLNLSHVPITGSITVHVRSQFITEFHIVGSNLSFSANYDINTADIITVMYAYNQ